MTTSVEDGLTILETILGTELRRVVAKAGMQGL